MTLKIVRFILRNIPDKWRGHLVVACLLEQAYVRPGHQVIVKLNVEHDGTHAFEVNGVEWSWIKKEKARSMLRSGYTTDEVSEAFGVSISELQRQLIDEEMVSRVHAKAMEAMMKREDQHNNLNHCNGAGCDGVSCESSAEHTKGEFS